MRTLFLLLAVAAQAAAALTPSHLRCEYLINPEAVETRRPRLTWLVESAERGARQTAYRILVASSRAKLAAGQGDLWDTGKRSSSETVNIGYAGRTAGPGRRYWWKVQVWDAAGRPSGWSASAYWGDGLGRSDWTAQWISYRDPAPLHKSRATLYLPAARYYRGRFDVAKPVRRATLYATALGVLDAYVNGRRVSDAMFSPGWSDYRKRAYYRAWDVTALVAAGANALGAEVAEGWYSGYVGYGLLVGYGPYKTGRAMYGKTPALRAELRLEFADGTSRTVGTDLAWKVAESPRREADILMGEHYDARREQPGWSTARFDDRAWQPAIAARDNGGVKATFSDKGGDREMEFGFVEPRDLQAYPGPPVRPIEEMRPKRILEPAPGTYVFDFGQNFSGVVRVRARGPAGTSIRIRHAEMIYPGGKLMTENLRKARATDTFTLRGDAAAETYTPRFTYHGFQYAELTGYPGKPTLDDVTGVVIHSDTPLTSRFESSDPMANRLFQNVVWTQRSNFVEIPTDCPQRDERLGWSGDAQIYAGAAAYHADTAAFYTKWLDDLEEAQREGGAYPDYAPYPMQHGGGGYAYGTAWMDVGVIAPWTVWRAYGDTEVIRRHWASMTRFLEFRARQSPDLRGSNRSNPWGDWLAIGSATPIEFIDAAYYARSAQLMAEMAGAIGKEEERRRYADLTRRIGERFRADYGKADGSLTVDTQTAYAMALAHGLGGDGAEKLAARLAALVAANGYRMSTGFLGTYPLLPMLSAHGHHDLAVRLFQSRQFPSWGYEVENGATTIWERWNSYTKDKGFFSPAMNSYSHYAFGAVSEWMFRTLAGVSADEPGYRRISIAPGPPAPGSNPEARPIDEVRAEYRSIRGRIAVHWKREAGGFTLECTVPPNTEATVRMPARDAASVTESGKAAKVGAFAGGKASIVVGAGSYRFRSTL
jgi:alpha-L-rhamnosidase